MGKQFFMGSWLCSTRDPLDPALYCICINECTLFKCLFLLQLKVSNWKKVLERLVDYYEVHLDQRLSGFAMPDVSKIGEQKDTTSRKLGIFP
jgi:hypothetical protein